jgi:hypothetical protein
MWIVPVAASIAFSLDRLMKQQEQKSGPRPPVRGEGFGLLIGVLGLIGTWVGAYVLGPGGYGLIPLTAAILLFYPGGWVALLAGFYAGGWIYRRAVKPCQSVTSGRENRVTSSPTETDARRLLINLLRENSVSSAPTPTSNYPAWAARDYPAWAAPDRGWYWWWPFESYRWPLGFPQDETVGAFVKLYAMIDYTPCVDGSLEPGYEKIALYAIGPAMKHVALQLPNGKWTSKLGKDIEKIEHTLDGLAGHGTPVQFLRRAFDPRRRYG